MEGGQVHLNSEIQLYIKYVILNLKINVFNNGQMTCVLRNVKEFFSISFF